MPLARQVDSSIDPHDVTEVAPSTVTRHVTSATCCVIDREPRVRSQLTAILDAFGIPVVAFDSLSDMLAARRHRDPDLIFIDITVCGSEGLELIDKLAAAAIRCPVQILTGLSPVLIEQIRRCGQRSGLDVLPVLHKPFQGGAIRRIVTALGLQGSRKAGIKIDLAEVIAEGWLELWYQPTIDLKGRRMVGAEAFVRARHPEHGILTPESFLADAGERELLDLTHRVLGRAMRDWPAFAGIGTPIELSINVPIVALSKLSLFAIMWEQKPAAANWPGLTLEISEEEVLANLALISKAMAELRPYGISMAIDNFGPGYAELSRATALPFKALKIDRSYISGCDLDRMNEGLCETIVEFAHKFGLEAVAEGIETAGEYKALHRMGCDIGQGYLFARPQTKQELVALIRQRSKTHDAS